jgi:hypothetical protein
VCVCVCVCVCGVDAVKRSSDISDFVEGGVFM